MSKAKLTRMNPEQTRAQTAALRKERSQLRKKMKTDKSTALIVDSWDLPKEASPEEIENELFEKTNSIIQAALQFPDFDPETESPPQSWIDEHGEDEAWRRFRVAQSAWAPMSKSPAGLQMAKSIFVGIVKARAVKGGAPSQLNMDVAVQMVQNINVLPEKEIE